MNERLLMPQCFHGTAGEEMSFYFANVYAALNPANYAFYFHCSKGSACEERWHFTPSSEDAGTLEGAVEVRDDDGVVASGNCRMIIHDPAKSAGKKVRLLMIGDSLTDQTHYPTHIHTLCRRYGIDLEMLGTNVPEILRNRPGQLIRYPEPELLSGVRHEGYGGWSANTFLTRKEPPENAIHHWQCASPFINAKGEFDFAEYIEKHCSGIAPDVIMIGLGGNDLGAVTDENCQEKIANYVQNMKTLYSKLRKAAPDAVFGITLNPYGTRNQDAWGKNCGCKRFRWDKRRLQPKAFRALEKEFCNQEKTFIIPLYHAIDPIFGYPREEVKAFAESDILITRQCNALHPCPAGYRQMGIAAFSWLLDILENHLK